jgi:beta-glucosidase
MEMASTTYAHHLASLVEEGRLSPERIDAMVANVLRVKLRLGLFERPRMDPAELPAPDADARLELAREAARRSVVLLHDSGGVLPLRRESLRSVAVIGPLADDPYEQLGTWIFDRDTALSRTPLGSIRELAGDAIEIRHVRGLPTTRSRDTSGIPEAVEAACEADVAVLFLGEESILSGEAHCRADIRLPGAQEELAAAVAETGTPTVLVLMAGRPLALEGVVERAGAVLFAWHPGTMAGPALVDLLFGSAAPSGKLPVSIPKMTGQIPIYYARRNTGRPATPGALVDIEAIEQRSPQTSVGNASFHLDAGDMPLYPFGHGLSYVRFAYASIEATPSEFGPSEVVSVSADVTNDGDREAEEVVQLYIRDLAGSVTRPVRELKGYLRVRLAPGETRRVRFELGADDLAFHGRDLRRKAEPGRFHVWIGGSSDAELRTEFELLSGASGKDITRS